MMIGTSVVADARIGKLADKTPIEPHKANDGLARTELAPCGRHQSLSFTKISPPSTFTACEAVGCVAGIVKAAPLRISNLAPCRGQAMVGSRRPPPPGGPPSCVQTSSM